MRLRKTLVIALVVCILAGCWCYAAVVKNPGYGVRNVTLDSTIKSVSISCPSSASKGDNVTASFSASYEKQKTARASFLHDGWNSEGHSYVTGSPSFKYTVTRAGKTLKSGSSKSVTFNASTNGTYTVIVTATVKATPNPKTAYVGVTNWTWTTMPTFTFTKTVSKKVTVNTKAIPEPKEEVKPVISLFLNPRVYHTDQWNTYRKRVNERMGKSGINSSTISLTKFKGMNPRPRYLNVFWAGERIMLSATTDPTVTSVTASILGTTYIASLKKGTKWTGSLWNKNMKTKWKGKYPASVTVLFTATYEDGKIITEAVNILMDGDVYDDLIHRAI
ncbi:MAG: hypothetical protein MJ146_00595 [Clostridia bacterium]|nr:hypothetical protein [Clostridia bacterium]